jgi:hypothetical protein
MPQETDMPAPVTTTTRLLLAIKESTTSMPSLLELLLLLLLFSFLPFLVAGFLSAALAADALLTFDIASAAYTTCLLTAHLKK